MSVAVSVEALFDQVGAWGFGYLLSVSGDQRPHLVALVPDVHGAGAERVLRFDAGEGRASRNAAERPQVSVVFPPTSQSGGYSLVVDGDAVVAGSFVDVRPTSAVLHRPAP